MTEATSRRLRLGMVGGGRGAGIGAVHRLAARMDDQYDFVAGALASDPERARLSGADLGLDPSRCYADYREMAKAEAARSDGIDVVAIVTPNHLHFDIACAFLKSGIHVICDKPMTTSFADANELVNLVEDSGLVFVLTHNYTGYPLIRQARDMVAENVLGPIRVVQVEYAQDWLATPLEASDHKQASWRTDPSKAGPGGCLGDIGTHAYNIMRFVTGLSLDSLAADLHSFVPDRKVDDNVQVMMRFQGGARGMLWSSQVAPGRGNSLRLRVYGEVASLEWDQENPNYMTFMRLGEAPQRMGRAGPGMGAAATAATRVPPGHPEGYLEGFAQLYKDAAGLIRAHGSKNAADASLLPDVRDGLDGMRFVEKVVASDRGGGNWIDF